MNKINNFERKILTIIPNNGDSVSVRIHDILDVEDTPYSSKVPYKIAPKSPLVNDPNSTLLAKAGNAMLGFYSNTMSLWIDLGYLENREGRVYCIPFDEEEIGIKPFSELSNEDQYILTLALKYNLLVKVK